MGVDAPLALAQVVERRPSAPRAGRRCRRSPTARRSRSRRRAPRSTGRRGRRAPPSAARRQSAPSTRRRPGLRSGRPSIRSLAASQASGAKPSPVGIRTLSSSTLNSPSAPRTTSSPAKPGPHRHLDALHVGLIERPLADQPVRHDAGLDDPPRPVGVAQEGVERPHPLGEAALERVPLLGREHPRHRVDDELIGPGRAVADLALERPRAQLLARARRDRGCRAPPARRGSAAGARRPPRRPRRSTRMPPSVPAATPAQPPRARAPRPPRRASCTSGPCR